MIFNKIFNKISSYITSLMEREALSGVLLIVASAAALIWANSSFGETYEALWHTHLSLGLGDFKIDKPLHIWINDGLMALFFFYVGLEIKHEFMVGELSDIRNASLPFFAAIGGMVVPAVLFYLMINGKMGAEGWGIPMATDIAFSLGILMLLGKSVPNSMKVFLTAFAIIDDIGAVLVIAIFYSSNISWSMLFIAVGVLGLLYLVRKLQIRSATVYFVLACVVWYFVLQSGVHPTVAGIAVAMMIPTNNRIRLREFAEETRSAIREFVDYKGQMNRQFLAKKQLVAIDEIEDYVDKVQPPLQRLEHKLDPVIAYFIMPIFALANAGVVFSGGESTLFTPLTFAIMIGLVFGKVIGIVFFSWIGVKLGWANLPKQTSWTQLVGLGFLGGIGFTMALFIANLAFDGDPNLLTPAKIGILIGSAIAGLTGYLILRSTLNAKDKKEEVEEEAKELVA